ncbi:MAG: ribose-phosphate pyrophosphokinase [Ignavibacteria bacterium]|nr:ribose-phosphate pyrophosphokinase [Ignavibacteria bacterium]
MMPDFKVAAGRSNTKLARKVADHLGIELSQTTIRNFEDGEIWVKFEENVRGVDMFIIQGIHPPADNLMELLILIDAAKRASVRRVTAVIPYFGYARQDRKDQPRVSITAKLIANLIERAGADRVITIDLHSSQIQGFFDIPLDHLYASPVFITKLDALKVPNLTIAAPDAGGVRTARSYSRKVGAQLVFADKRRPAHNVAEIMHIIGEVEGRNVVIVDDLIDTGSTFIQCADAIKNAGASTVSGICVHPVFSGSALDKIENCEGIDKLYVTDTIPLKRESKKIEIVSIADLLGEAIIRTYDNRSISSLFDIER